MTWKLKIDATIKTNKIKKKLFIQWIGNVNIPIAFNIRSFVVSLSIFKLWRFEKKCEGAIPCNWQYTHQKQYMKRNHVERLQNLVHVVKAGKDFAFIILTTLPPPSMYSHKTVLGLTWTRSCTVYIAYWVSTKVVMAAQTNE